MMTGRQKNWCYLTNIGTISTPKLTAECLLMLLAFYSVGFFNTRLRQTYN